MLSADYSALSLQVNPITCKQVLTVIHGDHPGTHDTHGDESCERYRAHELKQIKLTHGVY